MPEPVEWEDMRRLLDSGDFGRLFREVLLWHSPPDGQREDRPLRGVNPAADGDDDGMVARAVAEMRGVTVWAVTCVQIPTRAGQHRVVRDLGKQSGDRLVVFIAGDEQLWLWPEQRPSGTGHRLVDHYYRRGQGNDALLQRLERVRFTVSEGRTLTGPQVLNRVRQSFNVEKVTKSFYKEFQKHHQRVTAGIEGIPESRSRDRRWYASVLLDRLMFIYFIQHKGFMAGDPGYLRTCLSKVRDHFGADRFYAFFRQFLLPLFYEGLGSPPAERAWDDPVAAQIAGDVPYVNGGLFEQHALERDYDVQIADAVFEELFDFFDQWRWHLDESPTGANNEINPDILGFIFEQYINYTDKGQKEKGAYYTKPDVTGYMSATAIIPAVVDRLVAAGLEDPCVLLPGSGERYLHHSLGFGAGKPIPEGELPPSEFPDESLDLALPGERWCDVTHRRKRHAELVQLVDSGGVTGIDDAVTANLDMAGLMTDYFTQLNSAEECQQAFDVLQGLTVCDPTVGSGAFLLAALDVLDPMYTAVFDRADEISAGGGGSVPNSWRKPEAIAAIAIGC